MSRVLIANESGMGVPSLWDSLTIGKALAGAGHEVFYAVGDPIALIEFDGRDFPSQRILQAPTVPAAPQLVMRPPRVASLADQMALIGYGQPARLRMLSRLWLTLFEVARPDIIFAVGAPVATLVGPLCARTIVAGDGRALPPALGGQFPRQAADIAPIVAAADLVECANAVLTELGATEISSVTEIYQRCEQARYGLPVLDPYVRLRRQPSLGVLGRPPKPQLPPVDVRLALFLDINYPQIEAVIVALAGLGDLRADICVKGATDAMRRFLGAQAALDLVDDFGVLLEKVDDVTAVVHHGVPRLAEWALLTGKPQLILPWTGDQQSTLTMLKDLGVTWEKQQTSSIRELASTLTNLPNDASIAANSQLHAGNLAGLEIENALAKIVGMAAA